MTTYEANIEFGMNIGSSWQVVQSKLNEGVEANAIMMGHAVSQEIIDSANAYIMRKQDAENLPMVKQTITTPVWTPIGTEDNPGIASTKTVETPSYIAPNPGIANDYIDSSKTPFDTVQSPGGGTTQKTNEGYIVPLSVPTTVIQGTQKVVITNQEVQPAITSGDTMQSPNSGVINSPIISGGIVSQSPVIPQSKNNSFVYIAAAVIIVVITGKLL
jgi:hypothetical protein